MAGERRKDYMVSRRVHLLYMLTWITSLLLVGSLVAMAVTLKGASQQLGQTGSNYFILVGVLAFVIVCSALILAVYTIVHTHRLMGSAYRIGVVLKEVNAGQGTRIKLRDGDFFTDIADEINQLADVAQKNGAGKTKADPPAKAEEEPAEAEEKPTEESKSD